MRSELRKTKSGKADPGVVAWAEATDGNTMFVSSVTVLELEYGVRLLERRDAVQGAVMRRWLDEGVMRAFADHLLPVDEAIARHAGRLRRKCRARCQMP